MRTKIEGYKPVVTACEHGRVSVQVADLVREGRTPVASGPRWAVYATR